MLDSHLPPFKGNINFNAQHAPMGAYWNFTCGRFGSRGGFSVQSAKLGNQDIFIGAKRGARESHAPLMCLPFYQHNESLGTQVRDYGADQIQRRYGWATDRWTTPDIDFTIYSPFGGIVDPTDTHPAMSRVCLMPAILASLTIDNSNGTEPMTGVFALKFNEQGVWQMKDQHGWRGKHRVGFGLRRDVGFQAMIENEPGDRDASMHPFLRGGVLEALDEPCQIHPLGDCAGIWFEVPPASQRTLLIALGSYLDGIVTTRLEGKYFYARHFAGLNDVLDQALRGFDAIRAGSAELDRELHDTPLSDDQKFLVAHSTRSYYANTQLLDIAGNPMWVVNDGERGLINPLDAAVDHVFWELKQNPWVVRNLLDNYLQHYSYRDQLKGRRGEGEHELLPGGISFCHDMGAFNNFSPEGSSSYEMTDRSGQFAFSTQEQLCNWILIAASYLARTGDMRWATQNREMIEACMRSMLAREGAVDQFATAVTRAARQMVAAAVAGETSSSSDSGVWNAQTPGSKFFDSSRCGVGEETTTFDSMDDSLSKARNGVYLAVKRIAAYLGLEFLFSRLGDGAAEEAAAHAAHQLADAVSQSMNTDAGFVPANFDPKNTAHTARILPVVEPLMFPWYWGTCEYGGEYKSSRAWLGNGNESFVAKLKRHAITLLSDPEKRNLSSDEGLRMSSSHADTWLSKVAIFQHIAREVFNLNEDAKIRDVLRKADAAHVKWQTEGVQDAACSDRFADGNVAGGRSTPRGITTTLWLDSVRA